METVTKSTKNQANVWKMTMTAMLSAIAFVLMFLEFSVPVMPPFIKMDLSDLPELIGAFAMGPVSGVAICLIKNLLHLLGVCFVLPAGLVYRKWKGRKSAVLGALLGAILMAVVSIISNYYIVYPFYYNFMSKDAILSAYQAILPGVDSILQCLIVFNTPFTLVKGLFSVVITVLIYKHISPFLKGINRN